MDERVSSDALPLQAEDGHRWQLLARIPAQPQAALLWMPALGVAAKHYLPFADALAARGTAVFVHEWRGNGSSILRPGRASDWGYRELLIHDLPCSEAAIAARLPRLDLTFGGHSLGGQLACCRLALAPNVAQHLWLVASGAPYWRAFPAPVRYGLPLAYRFLPWLADRLGRLPGRRLGFGGEESRGLIGDWARSALSGRYAAAGIGIDIEAALGALSVDVHAVVMENDWLAPASSVRFLLSKMRHSRATVTLLGDHALQARADHFSWMQQPAALAELLTR
ncbi:serine aminopeptidase domain-containing protein [Lysobacter koreensis]|uniref:Serine aminopeptidase domain-containing protein n=1 Tax=Lysobacter koreensis TaxID=266122 RepID=A0ABW2YM70_9GAMM